MTDLLERKAYYLQEIDRLCETDLEQASRFVSEILSQACETEQKNPAVSAALAGCICRFLLHKKMKTRIIATLLTQPLLTRVLFGELNSYKYSLVFLLKRIVRHGDAAFLEWVLQLLQGNPYRDDSAADYAAQWSFGFLLREMQKAPPEYLQCSPECRAVLEKFEEI